jgi:hypothetical protein
MKSLKVLAIEAGGFKNQNLSWIMLTQKDMENLGIRKRKPMYLNRAKKDLERMRLIKSLYSSRWFGEGTRNNPYFYTVNERGVFTYYPLKKTLRVALHGKNASTYTNVDPAILHGSKRTKR